MCYYMCEHMIFMKWNISLNNMTVSFDFLERNIRRVSCPFQIREVRCFPQKLSEKNGWGKLAF